MVLEELEPNIFVVDVPTARRSAHHLSRPSCNDRNRFAFLKMHIAFGRQKVSEFNVAAGRTILEELENNVAKSTWFEDVDDKFSTCSSIQASSRSGSISEPTCTSRNVTLCRDSGNTLRILDSCTFVLHLRCGARVVKRTTSFDSCVAI